MAKLTLRPDFQLNLPNGLSIPNNGEFLDLPSESGLENFLTPQDINNVTALSTPNILILNFTKEDDGHLFTGQIRYVKVEGKLVVDSIVFNRGDLESKRVSEIKFSKYTYTEGNQVIDTDLNIRIFHNVEIPDPQSRQRYQVSYKTKENGVQRFNYTLNSWNLPSSDQTDLVSFNDYSIIIFDTQLKEAILGLTNPNFSYDLLEKILNGFENLHSSPNIIFFDGYISNSRNAKLPLLISDLFAKIETDFVTNHLGLIIKCPSADGEYSTTDGGTGLTHTIKIKNKMVVSYNLIKANQNPEQLNGDYDSIGFAHPAPGYELGEDYTSVFFTKNNFPVSLVIDTVSKKTGIEGKDQRFAKEFAHLLKSKLSSVVINDENSARIAFERIFNEIENSLQINGFPRQAMVHMVFSVVIKLNSGTLVYSNGDTRVVGISKKEQRVVFENMPNNNAYRIISAVAKDLDLIDEIDPSLVYKFMEIANIERFKFIVLSYRYKYTKIKAKINKFIEAIIKKVNEVKPNGEKLGNWLVKLYNSHGNTFYSTLGTQVSVSIPFNSDNLKFFSQECDIVLNMSDGVSDVIPPKTLNNILILFNYNIRHVNFIVSKLIRYIQDGNLHHSNPNHFMEYLGTYSNSERRTIELPQYADQGDPERFKNEILDILENNFTKMFDILKSCKEKDDDSSLIIMQNSQ